MDYHQIENLNDWDDLRKYLEGQGIQATLMGSLLETPTSSEIVLVSQETDEKFVIDGARLKPFECSNIIRQLRGLLDSKKILHQVDEVNLAPAFDPFIFGKDPTEKVVSVEVSEGQVEIFTEGPQGVSSEIRPYRYWLLSNRRHNASWAPLKGSLHYKYIKYYDKKQDFYKDKKFLKDSVFGISDDKEAYMVLNGLTYFKNMKANEPSVLAFDIETTGLRKDADSKIFLIANTFRRNGVVNRKTFRLDRYNNDGEMLEAWCDWVREVNPSIMLGHNIYGYDVDFIKFRAEALGVTLNLGRDGSEIHFNGYTSQFRKDGSQSYEYTRAFVYGREFIDTFFLSMKYDAVPKRYPNFKLKDIIKVEGLEVAGRVFYDAATIKDNWDNPEEREKIIKYAEFDGDDALALFDLQIPAYFYLTPSIPKSFQTIGYSASGAQINSFLVRSYLQNGMSIPTQSEVSHFEGAISIGNPGRYKNVFKVDIVSLYPSIMLEYQVFDKYKDPEQHFYKMVEFFTAERIRNKKLSKETGDRYYKDLQEAQKIVINSCYGMLGAQGLNFNSPINAALVTRKGREILQTSLTWATENGFTISNCDTDSISITYNGEHLSIEERKNIVDLINSLYPERIRFEDDGYYPVFIVSKAKNYILKDESGKVKTKGSSLKDPKRQVALQEFINSIINLIIDDRDGEILEHYHNYVKEIFNVTDISRWASKKTYTDKIDESERTNETKVLAALQGSDYRIGDKFFTYFRNDEDNSLGLVENWKNDHDTTKLLKSLHNTVSIFENVLDISPYINYALVKQINAAREIAGLPPIVKEKKTRAPRKKKDDVQTIPTSDALPVQTLPS